MSDSETQGLEFDFHFRFRIKCSSTLSSLSEGSENVWNCIPFSERECWTSQNVPTSEACKRKVLLENFTVIFESNFAIIFVAAVFQLSGWMIIGGMRGVLIGSGIWNPTWYRLWRCCCQKCTFGHHDFPKGLMKMWRMASGTWLFCSSEEQQMLKQVLVFSAYCYLV